MANKNQLKNSSLKTIEEENEKNKKLRQNEIDSIATLTGGIVIHGSIGLVERHSFN